MRKVIVLDCVITAVVAALASAPALALAGNPVTPAPVVGVGIGAVALMGIGYRALRRRIDK